ncbi:Bug family tripartite tricarboxylate transporter substrate binding protein [Streptomyces sp. NPDC127098]|uniref:Bug family tripartite tricarboxylate transporter substrate binding protein n=1 Tax=Streptomyces sp. NPDC127098 TaxID=3347137 RepID=UPI00365FD309
MLPNRARVTALLAVPGLLLAGCAAGPSDRRLRVMVPTVAGGGYDFTARTLAITLRESGLAGDVEVFNLTGGMGTVALTRLVHESGNDGLLLQMGLGLVGSLHTGSAPVRIGDATPLARLVDEPGTIVVAESSPYRTFDELLVDWRRGHLTAGIGSLPGGPDYLALMLTADAVGLPPDAVTFNQYDGGGGLLAALLSGQADVIVSGLGELRHAVAAGELRVLAVTGPRRVTGLDAPTLRECGYDVEVTNWRGLLAPPGLAQDRLNRLRDLIERLHGRREWRSALRENGWGDAYLPGAAFGDFLASETRRVGALLDRFAA